MNQVRAEDEEERLNGDRKCQIQKGR